MSTMAAWSVILVLLSPAIGSVGLNGPTGHTRYATISPITERFRVARPGRNRFDGRLVGVIVITEVTVYGCLDSTRYVPVSHR